jgi:hypothetical protein
MKIKFKVVAVGERFQIDGKTYRKEALSLAEDQNRIGHLMLAETEVEADESVRTMADTPVQPAISRRHGRRTHGLAGRGAV